MHIEKIELFHVESKLIAPFNTAFGDTTAVGALLVRLESAGVVGWGEAAPWSCPLYSSEWAGGAYIVARDFLGPVLKNASVRDGQQLSELFAAIKGNYFAKAAFDLALWDLLARRAGQPLWKYLGGKKGTVHAGADFGVLSSLTELLGLIAGALAEGAPRVKLKIRQGWDTEVLREVRREFPTAVIHIDANSGYTLREARVFQDLDELNLAMFEQPLEHDDLQDHATLARLVATPICLDESITSPTRARQAIEMGACRLINIKPGRVGGLTPALEVLRVARAQGVPCWIGGMLESAIGVMPCVALAALPGIGYASDIFPTKRFWSRDLADKDIEQEAPGEISAFDGDGIGCLPDEEELARRTIARQVL